MHKINNGYSSPVLDQVMIFLSSPIPWIFLLGVVVILGLYHRGLPFSKVALALIILVSLTDLIAYRLLKPNFARKRPCVEFTDLRTINRCGGEFGFPSNHAANSMAIAVFFYLYFRRPLWTTLLFVFALLMGLSRVYLGAHYPLDVLGGYVLGAIIAVVVYFSGRRYFV